MSVRKLRTYKRKKITSLVMTTLWVWGLLIAPAFASPSGGTVTSGTATIGYSGSTTDINQSTQKAAINWASFSIGSSETVNFNQPSVASITLNRVIGNERSVIEGALNATGRVFLINSNGVLFTGTSSVNTAGFVASTLNITDEDFSSGTYVFTSNGSTSSVINMGTITVKEGGYVGLWVRPSPTRGLLPPRRVRQPLPPVIRSPLTSRATLSYRLP